MEQEKLDFDSLPERRKLFIKHYLECRSGSEAARRAGFKATNANVQAYRILQNPAIKAYIDSKMSWDYDEWLSKVRGVYNDFGSDNWQAAIKALELAGKASGFIKENQVTVNQLSIGEADIDRMRQGIGMVSFDHLG